jgi:hypothetical protein
MINNIGQWWIEHVILNASLVGWSLVIAVVLIIAGIIASIISSRTDDNYRGCN